MESPHCLSNVTSSAESYGYVRPGESYHLCCELSLEVAVGLMEGANIVGPHWLRGASTLKGNLIEKIRRGSDFEPSPMSLSCSEWFSFETSISPLMLHQQRRHRDADGHLCARLTVVVWEFEATATGSRRSLLQHFLCLVGASVREPPPLTGSTTLLS